MPRKRRAVRYAGLCPAPRRGDTPGPPTRFPFCPMFQNGPRRQGYAAENLFKNVLLRRAETARP